MRFWCWVSWSSGSCRRSVDAACAAGAEAAFPELQIVARDHELCQRHSLQWRGAAAVVPEAVEASLQLGGIMLGATGGGNAGPIIEQLRRDGYAGLESIADA